MRYAFTRYCHHARYCYHAALCNVDKASPSLTYQRPLPLRKPLTTIDTQANILIPNYRAGDGLGGFIDGIVFHQLPQLHGMLSATVVSEQRACYSTSMITFPRARPSSKYAIACGTSLNG